MYFNTAFTEIIFAFYTPVSGCILLATFTLDLSSLNGLHSHLLLEYLSKVSHEKIALQSGHTTEADIAVDILDSLEILSFQPE